MAADNATFSCHKGLNLTFLGLQENSSLVFYFFFRTLWHPWGPLPVYGLVSPGPDCFVLLIAFSVIRSHVH